MRRHQIDLWIILSVIGLSIFGAFNLLGIRPDLLGNYLMFLFLGTVSFTIFFKLRMQFMRDNYIVLFFLFIALFILTFVIGDDVRGAKRWIHLYFFNFQTSEFFKPFFLLIMASLLSTANRFTSRRFLATLVAFVLPLWLIFLQPDLGSALMFLASFFVLVYFSGFSTKKLAYVFVVGIMLLPFAWHILRPYQQLRIIGFMNPRVDPQGITYNLNQAIITIGSGGIVGRGLGLSTQARHSFLPEYHTDFAFASLVEQFGFIGGFAVITLYAILLYRLVLLIFLQQNNLFKYLYLIGTLSFIALGVFVNIGMNLGLLPVTGVELPFISYGGSSVVSTMIMLGLALSK